MFERHYRELLNFLSRTLGGDRELAAELAQESYARIYASRPGPRPVECPRALLYTTARHLVTDHHRRRAVRDAVRAPETGEWGAFEPDLEAGPRSLEPDAVLDGRQRLAAIERAVACLPPRPREAFVLYKIDGLSRAEVAARMGVGVKTVETHLAVAMEACMRGLDRLDDRRAVPAAASPAPTPRGRRGGAG